METKSDQQPSTDATFIGTPHHRRYYIPFVRAEINLRHPDAKIPSKSRETDAGYDVASLEDVLISPGQIVHIDTGMAVVVPAGVYMTVEGRSSLYKNGVVPFRGIIDGGYTGNLTVSLMNVGSEPYAIKKGDRIGQIIAHQVISLGFEQVEEISPEYDIRGNNGFGSSGR